MTITPNSNLLILIAVLLPPMSLDTLGKVVAERTVQTPYGDVGPLALRQSVTGPAVWIEPYTGLPDRTDPRATIYAAGELGVRRILNWEMGVAVDPELTRGQPVIAADYIDWTRRLPNTFIERKRLDFDFDADALAHRSAFCPQMAAALHAVLPGTPDAVYLGIDGPRRETAAEARMFRAWGVDALGQNTVPEVTLAQELGLCYSSLITMGALAADQPQPTHGGELRHSLERILQALPDFIQAIDGPFTCDCAR